MIEKELLKAAEERAGSRDARITRMNALNRAVEYAHLIHLQTGQLPTPEEITEVAEIFLSWIYEPTIDRIREELQRSAADPDTPPPPVDVDTPF